MSKTGTRRHQQGQKKTGLSSYWVWLGIGVALIAVGLGGFYLGSAGSDHPLVEAAPAGADMAPDFTLNTPDGDSLTLADYRGQVVLVNFWATWCPPCRAELPDLVAYYHAHEQEGFTLLGVNEQEAASAASTFLTMQGLNTYPVVLDSNGMVMQRYGVSGLPSSFLISPDGQILHSWTGMINRTMLEETITPLLNGDQNG